MKTFKKILLGIALLLPVATFASVLGVQQGGTGASTLSGCLQGNGIGAITGTGSACGAGGGGGSGGTFSTTTSSVTGEFINFPNNNTDIVTVGGSATTSAKAYFDPNISFAKIFNQFFSLSSTTLQALTFTNATGSQATTTSFFSTNLFGTTGNLTNLTVANIITGSVSGNAGTATTLATGRTIAITGDLTYTSPSFDGSGNVTAAGTLATVNANTGSFGSSTAIPTFTVNGKGLITAAGVNTPSIPASEITTGTFGAGDYVFPAKVTATNASSTLFSTSYASSTQYFGAGLVACNSASNAVTWSAGVFGCNTISAGSSASSTLLADNNTFSGNDVFTNAITGSVTGNAGTATKLSTARTIAITGDLAYTSPSFDGSGNVTAAGTLATVNSNVGSFTNANITVNGKGLITAASNGSAGAASSTLLTDNNGFTGLNTFTDLKLVTRSTTTQATTTNFAISNIASGNCLQTSTGGAIIGSGSACGSGGSSASSTLLADNNAFTGLNTFTDLKLVTRSTTTNATTTSIASTLATTTNLFVSNVGGSVSGKFLAADINGKVIDLNSTLLVLSIVHGGTGAADSVDGFDNLSPLGTKGDILTDTDIHNVALAVGSDESFLQASSTQTDGLAYSKISLARSVLDTLAVSHGGTACSSGSITCIDNITGGTHTGTGNNVAVSVAPVFTGITSVANLLASASSTLQAFTFTNATGSAYQLTGTNNVPVLGIYSPAVNQMAFSTASTFRGLFDANGRFALGTSTPTFDFTIASTSPTFELDDTDGATNNKHLLMSYNSGIFAIGTSSDTTLTSTSTDLTLNPLGPASFSVGTTSTAAILNLGDNPNESGTASSTMSTSGKFQIDTYNNAGARVCVEITTLNVFTVIAGACTN